MRDIIFQHRQICEGAHDLASSEPYVTDNKLFGWIDTTIRTVLKTSQFFPKVFSKKCRYSAE